MLIQKLRAVEVEKKVYDLFPHEAWGIDLDQKEYYT
jgi:hypothetical protein